MLVLSCSFKVSKYISACRARGNFLCAFANTFFINITNVGQLLCHLESDDETMEGHVVFVKNLNFDTNEDSLKEVI